MVKFLCIGSSRGGQEPQTRAEAEVQQVLNDGMDPLELEYRLLTAWEDYRLHPSERARVTRWLDALSSIMRNRRCPGRSPPNNLRPGLAELRRRNRWVRRPNITQCLVVEIDHQRECTSNLFFRVLL